MHEQKENFSSQFWSHSKQGKKSLTKIDVKSTLDISDINSDGYEQFKGSLPGILCHLKVFFAGPLNFENVKIEFIDHYDSLEISFKRDDKHLTYLRKRSSEYQFIIAMKWEITQISIEFKNLYKFLGIMGEQFNFQNSQALLTFLQRIPAKTSRLHHSRFFSNKKGSVSAPVILKTKNDLRDYNSSEHTESSKEYSNVEWQRPNYVCTKA